MVLTMICKILLPFSLLRFTNQEEVPPIPQHSGFMSEDVAKDVVQVLSVWKPNHKQNIWELSGQYEGDIMTSPNNDLSKNTIILESRKWPKGILPYYIHKDFGEDEVATIKGAIKEIEKSTCIRFRKYEKQDKDYVVVKQDSPGCWSYPGKQGGGQVLNLSKKCVRHGVIVHEFLHALGFYHQQSATNRDDFLTIHWENIRQEAVRNFNKYNSTEVTDHGIEYDYGSIMHYGKFAFSKNEQPTISPKDPNVKIGQRKHLSQNDIKKINTMYNCDCKNGTNSNNSIDKAEGDEDEDYLEELDDIVYNDVVDVV